MLSRERVRKAIRFEEPDRVPLDLGGSDWLTGICAGAYNQLKKHLGYGDLPTEVWTPFTMTAYVEEPIRQRLGLDVVPISTRGMGFGPEPEDYVPWNLPSDGSEVRMPRGFQVRRTADGGYAIDGAFRMYMPKDEHYFDVVDWENADSNLLDAVNPRARKDLKELRKELRLRDENAEQLNYLRDEARHYYHNTDYALMAECFAISLPTGEGIADLTNAIMLMREDPDYVSEWYDVMAEEAVRRLEPVLDALEDHCEVLVVTCCDLGNQQCEFIPPDLFEKFYIPPYRKINNFIHKHSDMKTFFHACGSIPRLIPHYIAAGVDILNPIQTMARGMEPAKLKEQFGGKIVFWGGGVETQTTLPLGSVEDVIEEVTGRVRTFMPGGGFVFNPIHNVQDLVAPEKILAAYDTARRVGKYGCSIEK